MIIKGKSRSGPLELAAHLRRTDTNELVRVIEARGTVAQENMREVLEEMDAFAAGTRCQKSLYHASISPSPTDPEMEAEQWAESVERLEERLGLTDQPRLVVAHIKEGRAHLHVVWSRIDQEQQKAIHDGWNYRAHEEVARELERSFGHERVQGAHAERDGVERPPRTPSMADIQQQQRSGVTVDQVRADATEAYHASADGADLQQALDERGYILAKGDRRDYVILDQACELHSLARRIDGVRAAQLREFMHDLDPANVPNVEEAKHLWAERLQQRAIEAAREQGEGKGKAGRSEGRGDSGGGAHGAAASPAINAQTDAARRAQQRAELEALEQLRLKGDLDAYYRGEAERLRRETELRKQDELRVAAQRAREAKEQLESQLAHAREERGLVTRFLDWVMPQRLAEREQAPRDDLTQQAEQLKQQAVRATQELDREQQLRAQILKLERETKEREALNELTADQRRRAFAEELRLKAELRHERERRERAERGQENEHGREWYGPER